MSSVISLGWSENALSQIHLDLGSILLKSTLMYSHTEGFYLACPFIRLSVEVLLRIVPISIPLSYRFADRCLMCSNTSDGLLIGTPGSNVPSRMNV